MHKTTNNFFQKLQPIRKNVKPIIIYIYIEYAKAQFYKLPFTAKDSATAAVIARDLNRGRTIGTKLNYVCLLRNYFNYCILHGEDPSQKTINPIVAIHWMYSLCLLRGSCNSRKSWSATLSYWVWSSGGTPVFYKNTFYKRIKEVMIKLYSIERKERLPMPLDWLTNYLQFLGVTPTNMERATIQNLTIALWYIMLFMTISRPAELLYTNSTEDERVEVITTGLKWGDITHHNTNRSKYAEYISIEIHWFKNQQFRNQSKIIDMQSPLCRKHNCMCQYYDYIRILRVLKQKRNDLVRKLNLQHNQNGYLSTGNTQQLYNLGTEADNYVFVGQNGKIWTPTNARQLHTVFLRILAVKKPKSFPLYSFRIGAMSRINQQRVDLLKALRYVAWAISNLPHVSNRYINFTSEELRTIPFELIHGGLDKHGVSHDRSHTALKTFDLANAKHIIYQE